MAPSSLLSEVHRQLVKETETEARQVQFSLEGHVLKGDVTLRRPAL